MKYLNILALALLIVISCNNDITEETTESPTLLFKSGFESGVYIDSAIMPNNEDYRFLRGTDAETGFSWPIDILGASESGIHYIADDNQQAVYSELQTVIGHNGNTTKALFQKENYQIPGYTQCPYEILNITEGRTDLYIKYWMKIDSNTMSADSWRVLFEYKTKDYALGTGFRLISYIYKDATGNPYWHWQGDADPQNPVWEIDNRNIPVPRDEWFKVEYFWHWSEGNNGRALWKVNDQIVGEHFGATTRNSKPIDFIILTQIYGDSNPKHQWIDDIEIWDTIPY